MDRHVPLAPVVGARCTRRSHAIALSAVRSVQRRVRAPVHPASHYMTTTTDVYHVSTCPSRVHVARTHDRAAYPRVHRACPRGAGTRSRRLSGARRRGWRRWGGATIRARSSGRSIVRIKAPSRCGNIHPHLHPHMQSVRRACGDGPGGRGGPPPGEGALAPSTWHTVPILDEMR